MDKKSTLFISLLLFYFYTKSTNHAFVSISIWNYEKCETMLNHVLSYPTTIYIDKKGKVRKIHTGFNGPATGEKYISFQKEFTEFVDVLVAE